MLNNASAFGDETGAALVDARRPGRANISVSLIPLLRDPANGGRSSDELPGDLAPHDAVGAMRGIALAVVLCTPVWLGTAALVYFLYQ